MSKAVQRCGHRTCAFAWQLDLAIVPEASGDAEWERALSRLKHGFESRWGHQRRHHPQPVRPPPGKAESTPPIDAASSNAIFRSRSLRSIFRDCAVWRKSTPFRRSLAPSRCPGSSSALIWTTTTLSMGALRNTTRCTVRNPEIEEQRLQRDGAAAANPVPVVGDFRLSQREAGVVKAECRGSRHIDCTFDLDWSDWKTACSARSATAAS